MTATTDKKKNGALEPIDLVYRYIGHHFKEALPIKLLARVAGMNESIVKHEFKKTYQATIHQFIIQKRLAHAKVLLTTTNDAIKSIAFDVGYRPRNFFVVFKKHFGITPAAYRKQHQQTNEH